MSIIEQIKQVRDALGIGLTEAKTLIEQFSTSEKAIEAWNKQQEEKRLEEEVREFVDPKEWMNRGFWKEHGVDEKDLEILKQLTPNYCKRLWSEFVTEYSADLIGPEARKQWKIQNNTFLKGYNWDDDWEDNQLNGLGTFLEPYLDWNPDDMVYVFFGRDGGYQMNWELFLKYSEAVLPYANGNVLVNINSTKVVIFEELGLIQIGERI